MAPSRIVRTEEFYLWDRNTALTPDELNRRFVDLHLRLQFAETEKLSDATLRQEISDKVLLQSEAVISGLRDKLLSLTQLEWLTAPSASNVALVEGATRTFVIAVADRALFTPGPYVIIGREGAPDTYAVARAQTFDRDSGEFVVSLTVVVTPDGPGPWSDWEIGSLAGSTLAQLVLLQRGYAARDEALQARDVATDKRNQAVDAAGVATQASGAAAAALALTQESTSIAVAARDVATQKAADAQAAAEGLVVPGFATASEIRAAAEGTKIVGPAQLAASMAFVDLGDVTGTVTIDCSAGLNFRMRLVGNVTLADFTNKKDGWSGVISIRQDGTGSRTIAKSTAIKGPAPTLSTAAGTKDRLAFIIEGNEVGITALEKNVGA